MLNNINKQTLNDNNCLVLNNKNNLNTFVLNRSGIKAITFMYMLYYKSTIYLDRKYKLFLHFQNCRFKAKALKLLEGKIGEG